jgi:hypothetical protein
MDSSNQSEHNRKRWLFVICLLLGFSLLLANFHGYAVNLGEHIDDRTLRHQRIINSTGDSPWAYRILTPYMVEWLEPVFRNLSGLRHEIARENVYVFFRWLYVFPALVGFHYLMERWLLPSWALTATMLFIALHGPSYVHYWYQPASPLDLCLWIWAVIATLRGKYIWLFPMVLIGTLNRETACFIVAIHFFLRLGEEPLPKLLARCTALGLVWLALFLGLREGIEVEGWAPGAGVGKLLKDNLTNPQWLFYTLSFLGFWAILPFTRIRSMPKEMKRLLMAMVPYVLLVVFFGRIREVRLLLPLCIPLVPAAMLIMQREFDTHSTQLPADKEEKTSL